MKTFKTAIAALTLLLVGSSAWAASGWFSDYLKITSAISGEGDYYWIGGDPSFGTQLAGHDFGTVSVLRITGADMKYWNNVSGRDGGAYYWRIDAGSITEDIWTQAYLGGNDFQGTDDTDYNVALGLSPGTYNLIVWAKSWGAEGDSLLNAGGSNYTASFTVVPEPSTALLSLLAGTGLLALRRRR
jgi:hypothetical protein